MRRLQIRSWSSMSTKCNNVQNLGKNWRTFPNLLKFWIFVEKEPEGEGQSCPGKNPTLLWKKKKYYDVRSFNGNRITPTIYMRFPYIFWGWWTFMGVGCWELDIRTTIDLLKKIIYCIWSPMDTRSLYFL